jgi:hypothetical protein
MACRDYRDDPAYQRDMQGELDILSRIACKALTHIEQSGDGLEILVLKDPEIAKWWLAHKEADRKEQEKLRKEQEKQMLRKSALSKLSAEERKALGIK